MNGTALRTALLGLAAATALAGCGTINVRSDTSAAASVSACHTYSWLEAPGGRPDAFGNPLNDQRLRDAIAHRLQLHGMTPAAPGASDCQIGYVSGTRGAPDEYNSPRITFGVGTGWGGWGRTGAMGSVYVDSSNPAAYRESRVSVDLFRSPVGPGAPLQPLWHASVDLDLSALTGAEAEKRINAAVAAMFAKYPVAR